MVPLGLAAFATDEIWFEPYMKWLNTVLFFVIVLLSVPWAFKAGMSIATAAVAGALAFLTSIALLLLASIPIAVAQPDQDAALTDWHYDVSAPQWAIEYALLAAAALLLPLACRLRFSLGLRRLWPLAAVALAVALAIAGVQLLRSP